MPTPTLASATPGFFTLPPWPIPALGTAAGWAERLAEIGLHLMQQPLASTHMDTERRPGAAPASKRPVSGTAALSAAVASIVAIAAQRALAAGELPKFREAIDRALDALTPDAEAGDPRDNAMPELPRIADADPAQEVSRLMRLLRGQSGR